MGSKEFSSQFVCLTNFIYEFYSDNNIIGIGFSEWEKTNFIVNTLFLNILVVI